MLRLSMAIARKDLALCLLRGSGLLQAVLLGLVLIFIFGLAGETGSVVDARTAAAAFWLSSLFCMVLVFGRLFGLEEGAGARSLLVLCGAPVQAIWLGKAAAGFVLVACGQCVFLPATLVFLGQDVCGPLWRWAAALALVDAGLAALGCLLGALGHGREGLLSALLFPLLCPLLLAGIGLGAQAFGNPGEDRGWLALAAAFDAVFFAAGLALFGFVFPGDD